jgi:hypothetical protein
VSNDDDDIVVAKDAIGKTCDPFSVSMLQILQGTSLDRATGEERIPHAMMRI